jgi:hypothetical protein
VGVVYRAYDEKLKRQVALKVLADGAARVERLLADARAAAALTHASIAAIYDVQQVGGVAFLVMELVEGDTLRRALSSGKMPLARSLALAQQIAEGLSRAHKLGIVHRDLKPENVIVTTDDVAKVLDFSTGVAGTPQYMSPEQAAGGAADARSDVFSFGVVLYEMLAGQRPFAHRDGDPSAWRDEDWVVSQALRTAAPEVPTALEHVVSRCLEREPSRRYADAMELVEALRTVRSAGGPRKARAIAAVVALAGLAVAAGAVGLGVARSPAPRTSFDAAGQRWEIVDGDWRRDGDTLVGTSGHAQTTIDLADATLSLDLDLAGKPPPTVGVGFRYSLTGDDPRAQCGYGFNLRGGSEAASFLGENGDWGPVGRGYQATPALHAGANHLVVRMKGADFRIEVNGTQVDAFTDSRWPHGRVNLWVSRGEARFSNVRVAPPE